MNITFIPKDARTHTSDHPALLRSAAAGGCLMCVMAGLLPASRLVIVTLRSVLLSL
jgi:hypothetical protein